MTGYLGGSFDPIHLGHLRLATEALERFSLDRVRFVPVRYPPHKDPDDLTSFENRLAMLNLALLNDPLFEVADLEKGTPPYYTVDLLRRISSAGSRPCFIMGMDSLCEFHTWKEPEAILQLARVLVGVRPGFDYSPVDEGLLKRVELFRFPGVWVSSSDIRKRASQGRSISYLVPESVESYIRSRGLYGTEKGH